MAHSFYTGIDFALLLPLLMAHSNNNDPPFHRRNFYIDLLSATEAQQPCLEQAVQ